MSKLKRVLHPRIAVKGIALLALLLPTVAQAATGKTVRVYNGAIAYHRATGDYGYAVNAPTAREARVEALRRCGHSKCEVVARLRNDCGALANGPKRFTIGKGSTREEAETKALRACGERCEIVVWACTR